MKTQKSLKPQKASLIIFFTPPPKFVHGGTPAWVVLLWMISTQLMFQLGWASVQLGHLSLIPQYVTCNIHVN